VTNYKARQTSIIKTAKLGCHPEVAKRKLEKADATKRRFKDLNQFGERMSVVTMREKKQAARVAQHDKFMRDKMVVEIQSDDEVDS
jgi:hypothetical protein